MPGARPVRLATRGSTLALKQAHLVAAMLAPILGERKIAIEVINTRGDVRQDLSLTQLGEGVFVKAIEEELVNGRADLAVHSFKDVPSVETPGLVIGAVPEREDPRDALVTSDGRGLADLPRGALLATGSPRRIAQLRAIRRDLRFTGVRGNVDTRLRKLVAGEFDGLVIAVAGLNRLGLRHRISTIFSVEECVPAVCQGALAIQCRSDDAELLSLLTSIDDAPTHIEARAERSFLAAIGGGCRIPVGALARCSHSELRLRAVVANDAGDRLARSDRSAALASADELGVLVAEDLKASVGDRPDGPSVEK